MEKCVKKSRRQFDLEKNYDHEVNTFRYARKQADDKSVEGQKLQG